MNKRGGAKGYWRVFYALVLSNATSVLFFVLRAIEADSRRYDFLIWNLFLAWLPLGFAWWLVLRLRRSEWQQPFNLLLSALWLGFLPNSFYLISDLIHLEVTGEVSLLYDVVLMCSFIFNGYVAGLISMYLVHRELIKRAGRLSAHAVMGTVLLACSFAIYLGRNLRWNTWDVLINPGGILFDVSDRVINPASHPQAFVTTATFFVLLASVYAVIWNLVEALRADNR